MFRSDGVSCILWPLSRWWCPSYRSVLHSALQRITVVHGMSLSFTTYWTWQSSSGAISRGGDSQGASALETSWQMNNIGNTESTGESFPLIKTWASIRTLACQWMSKTWLEAICWSKVIYSSGGSLRIGLDLACSESAPSAAAGSSRESHRTPSRQSLVNEVTSTILITSYARRFKNNK